MFITCDFEAESASARKLSHFAEIGRSRGAKKCDLFDSEHSFLVNYGFRFREGLTEMKIVDVLKKRD